MPVSIQHQRSANHTLRIVCPNGHLGFAPIKTGSFAIGVDSEPDLICADFGILRHWSRAARRRRVFEPAGLADA